MPSAVRVEHDLMVPMRDGVRLATDVYHPAPAAGAPPPVLLYRTPYGKDEMAANWGYARYFAERGYTVVQQDVRGCHASEGVTDFLRPEADDGLDTLRWIAAQTWGNADVGSWGTSWSGWTQTAMAGAGASRLKTIVPMMSGSDAWQRSVRHHGALELRWIAWAFWHAAENRQSCLRKSAATEEELIHPSVPLREWLAHWPLQRGATVLARLPGYEDWVFDLLEHESRDAYWSHPAYLPQLQQRSDVSALYIGSWYDSYAADTPRLFNAHPGKARLLMGPWLHGTQTVAQAHAGGIGFGADAALVDHKALLCAWFDHELKGQEPGVLEHAPVRLYVMGGGSGARDAAGRLEHGGRWRDETEWPLARTVWQRLHLHADGRLDAAPPSGDNAVRGYRYDPQDPVPTIGGCISSMAEVPADAPAVETYHQLPHAQRIQSLVAPGGYDQRCHDGVFQLRPRAGALASRDDVLVFQTAPLQQPLEVTGVVRVCLWVDTDGADTDFTAKLLDVYPANADWPEGYALNLSDSILRLRFRDGSGQPKPVTPGEPLAIEIELYPTSNLFAAGHRLRVDISSSNFPRFDRNPNTGESPHEAQTTRVAHNHVHCSTARASHLLLPVIPAAGALP